MMDAAEIAKWKDELESLGAIGDGDKGSTMKEIATEMKIPLRRMMTVIQKGLKGGRYVQGIAARMDNAGRRQRVPVYRLVE